MRHIGILEKVLKQIDAIADAYKTKSFLSSIYQDVQKFTHCSGLPRIDILMPQTHSCYYYQVCFLCRFHLGTVLCTLQRMNEEAEAFLSFHRLIPSFNPNFTLIFLNFCVFAMPRFHYLLISLLLAALPCSIAQKQESRKWT
jgi:hypothetical protein